MPLFNVCSTSHSGRCMLHSEVTENSDVQFLLKKHES